MEINRSELQQVLLQAEWRSRLEKRIAEAATCCQSDDFVLSSPCAIRWNLFLGNEQCARNIGQLQAIGVSHVVNFAFSEDGVNTSQAFYSAAKIAFKGVEAFDDDDCDILEHFNGVYEFIKGAQITGGKVMIHCVAGMNRSAAVIVAFLMREERLPLLEAAAHCATCRGPILSNQDFQKRLVLFAFQEGLLERESDASAITSDTSKANATASLSPEAVELFYQRVGREQWLDFDIAQHLLGVILGVFPSTSCMSDWKFVFWTANPLGDALYTAIERLAMTEQFEMNEDNSIRAV